MDSHITFVDAAGSVSITVHSSTLIQTEITGSFGAELATSFLATFDAWHRSGATGLCAFHNWRAMTNYDQSSRVRLTAWTLERRKTFGAIHFILGSTLVEFGVRAANLALGGLLTVHKSLEAFDVALERAGARTPVLPR